IFSSPEDCAVRAARPASTAMRAIVSTRMGPSAATLYAISRVDAAKSSRYRRFPRIIPRQQHFLRGHDMRAHTRILTTLAGVVAGTALVVGQGQGYKITVSQDRLINAQNEPQNWLLMNGDYGSTRYSKLAQINRENIKNLHMVWAMALGGMQDVGQNGPENEVNPLIDNGYMYTSDGWGTLYKIDARDGMKGSFAWVADPGVKHQGNPPR